MSEQLLTLLKLSLLAVLYLFLFRVVRAVWAEITPPATVGSAPGRRGRAPAPPGAGTRTPAAAAATTGRRGRRRGRAATPSKPRSAAPSSPTASAAARPGGAHLVVVAPEERRGTTYAVGDEVTIGRGGGCAITLDDTFASQLHARLFRSGDGLFVEDLGSTNGTELNGERLGGPRPLRPGDRLRVGTTELELR